MKTCITYSLSVCKFILLHMRKPLKTAKMDISHFADKLFSTRTSLDSLELTSIPFPGKATDFETTGSIAYRPRSERQSMRTPRQDRPIQIVI